MQPRHWRPPHPEAAEAVQTLRHRVSVTNQEAVRAPREIAKQRPKTVR
jgi:hypothetical protein